MASSQRPPGRLGGQEPQPQRPSRCRELLQARLQLWLAWQASRERQSASGPPRAAACLWVCAFGYGLRLGVNNLCRQSLQTER